MRNIINSTSTQMKGWQADCWNWAKAHAPFALYGVETQHLPLCRELSAVCRFKFHSRLLRNESVATFKPAPCP
jgi:hypothetical protein